MAVSSTGESAEANRPGSLVRILDPRLSDPPGSSPCGGIYAPAPFAALVWKAAFVFIRWAASCT